MSLLPTSTSQYFPSSPKRKQMPDLATFDSKKEQILKRLPSLTSPRAKDQTSHYLLNGSLATSTRLPTAAKVMANSTISSTKSLSQSQEIKKPLKIVPFKPEAVIPTTTKNFVINKSQRQNKSMTRIPSKGVIAVGKVSSDAKKTESEPRTEPTTPISSPDTAKSGKNIQTMPRSKFQVLSKKTVSKQANSGLQRPLNRSDYFLKELRDTYAYLRQNCVEADDPEKEAIYEYFLAAFQAMHRVKHEVFPALASSSARYTPRDPSKKLLVLDLDETLIHCTGDVQKEQQFQMRLEFTRDDGVVIPGLLNIRPYAVEFLRKMSQQFEIVIFTASMKYYADTIINVLDPSREFISQIFYRESCTRTSEGLLVKDLRIFGGRSLQDVVLVDNNPYTFAPQVDNGIPIFSYYNDESDIQLKKLESFLMELKKEDDVPRALRDYFKLGQLMKAEGIEKAFKLIANSF